MQRICVAEGGEAATPLQGTATLTQTGPVCSPYLHSYPVHTPHCFLSLQVWAAVRAMLETSAGKLTLKPASPLETISPLPLSLQVRAAVRAMLETRAGEPPLTGRELRLLVAMLDSNSSGTLTRQEFEDGLRDCRCVKGGGFKGVCHPAAPRGEVKRVLV